MICVTVAENTETTIYLDIHHIEKNRGTGSFSISGTLGDGLYEGEILLEVDEEVDVTFADKWLDRKALQAFFNRNGDEEICAALREAVSSMIFCLENFPAAGEMPREKVVGYEVGGRPHRIPPRKPGEQMELPMQVAEMQSSWRAVA